MASFDSAQGAEFAALDSLRSTAPLRGEVFIPMVAAARLAGLTLGKDDRILLATGWSEGYRADYVYYGFAVDGSGNVRYVEDCGEAMSETSI